MTEQASYRKIRGFVVDQHSGKPVSNVVLLFSAEIKDNNTDVTFPLGMLATDATGYASFDLSPFPEDRLPNKILITPLGDEQAKFSLDLALYATPAWKIQYVIKVDANRTSKSGKSYVGLASIQNPDEIDREVSPHSFTVKSELILGEGECQTPIPPPFPLRDFQFARVVLVSDPDFENDLPQVRKFDPTKALEIENDDSSYQIRLADVLMFRQRWYSLGHSLGQIVYSLPLAPCESVNLAVLDWSRQDSIIRQDDVTSREALYHDQRRDREIEEAVGAALREAQTGFSLMGGSSHADSAGAAATIPIYGIPVNVNAASSNVLANGASIAHTNGSRDITADSLQELHDHIQQATSVVRSLNSTVIVQATQQEQSAVQTRTVTNHNHCHALTIQYYEVLRSFKVVTEFEKRRRVVLIPFKIVTFDWQIVLRFETLLQSVLLDPSLAGCFEAIRRFRRCPNIYPEADQTAPAAGEGGGEGEASKKPTPKIQKYELTLTTGKAKEWEFAGIRRTFGNSWGPVTISLTLKDGTVKTLFHKPNISEPGGFAFQYEQDYVASIPFPNECVGLNPSDIDKVGIRWMESNADDAWGCKGIKIRYQIESEDKLNYTLLEASAPIYLVWFDMDGAYNVTTWEQNVTAPPILPPKEPEDTGQQGDAVGTPQRPARLSKKADECCEQQLISHLNANIGYYNRAIWFLQDPVERRILLEELIDNFNISDLIDEMPVAVSGRYVAFPFDDPRLENILLQPAVQKALSGLGLSQDLLNEIWSRAVEAGPQSVSPPEPLVSYTYLPTRGLFAEAQLGHCNSCEVRDVTRFWQWDESPCAPAPQITNITPGPQGIAPTIPQPASLPNPIVNVMQAPSAPDPVGLAAALQLLGTPNIFRDMSGLAELSQLLGTLASGAVTSTQEAQKLAQQAHDKLQALRAQAATQGGGTQQKQTAAERFDNLQVAKEVANAADELGLDDEQKADLARDIIGDGGGGGFLSDIRRVVEDAIKGQIGNQPKITSSTSTPCVNENVTFTLNGVPASVQVSWSGGGNPGVGAGTTFTTRFPSSGSQTIKAEYATDAGIVNVTATVTVKEPSGPQWEPRWPRSNSTADLIQPFRGNVERFIAALQAAGANVNINTTYRPRERAYLMHYAPMVANGTIAPQNVPAEPGVDICWLHRDVNGNADLPASRAAAQQLANAFAVAYPAAFPTRHSLRVAIDMTITWNGNLVINDGNGNPVNITSVPRTGADNSDLHAVGATYGVIKRVGDPPHWSDTGS